MSNFFSSTTNLNTFKSPEKLIDTLVKLLQNYLNPELESQKTSIEPQLVKRICQIKNLLYGDSKSEVDEDRCKEVAGLSIQSNLMSDLVRNIEILPFEARKDTAHIFNNFVRKNLGDFVSYVSDHFEIVQTLVKGYTNAESALNCGSMLRECIRYESLAAKLLNSEYLWLFFDTYVHLRNFDVASDSFNTLRDLLTTPLNKAVSSSFLHVNYESVMAHYDKLLKSDNFVTRWRSLKLLGDLLLDRSNFAIMIRYISSKENLKTIMNLLRDKSPNIQYEAFHVFKVFVAYPNKPADICLILYRNREKLIGFLGSFHSDKEDSQFVEEKCLLIETLSILTKPVVESASAEAYSSPLIKTSVATTSEATACSSSAATPVSSETARLVCPDLTKINYGNTLRTSNTSDNIAHTEKQEKGRRVKFSEESGQTNVQTEVNAVSDAIHVTDSAVSKATGHDSAINNM